MDTLEELLNNMLNALPTILNIKQKCIHYTWDINGQERGAILQTDASGRPYLYIYKRVNSRRICLYEGHNPNDAAWCLHTGEEYG